MILSVSWHVDVVLQPATRLECLLASNRGSVRIGDSLPDLELLPLLLVRLGAYA